MEEKIGNDSFYFVFNIYNHRMYKRQFCDIDTINWIWFFKNNAPNPQKLHHIDDKNFRINIIKKYNQYVQSFIKPLSININFVKNFKQSNIIKNHTLSTWEKNDLGSIMNFENNIKEIPQNGYSNCSLYFNKQHSYKRFIYLELSSHHLFNINKYQTNNSFIFNKFNTIMVISKYMVKIWDNFLKENYFEYDKNYKIIRNKNDLRTILKSFKYTFIVITDDCYNDCISFLNSEQILIERMIFESIFSLYKITNKPRFVLSIIFATSHINNALLPISNSLLDTKVFYKIDFIQKFLKDYIHKMFSLSFNSFKILQLYQLIKNYKVNNNISNNSYLKNIIEFHYNNKYITDNFESIQNLTLDNVNNKIEDISNEYKQFNNDLNGYIVGNTNINQIAFRKNHIYYLDVLNSNGKKSLENLINRKEFSKIISVYNPIVTSIKDIVETVEGNEESKQNILSRITTGECLVCFNKPDIEVISNCCKQLFCMECYMESIKTVNRCPLCRSEVNIEQLYINSDSPSKVISTMSECDLDSIISNSNLFNRISNFDKIIKYITNQTEIPKIMVIFTDYQYRYYSNDNSSQYGKSIQYKNIVKTLKKYNLNHMDLIGNFNKNLEIFNNPFDDFIDVLILNDSFNKRIKDLEFNFKSVDYVIYYNTFNFENTNYYYYNNHSNELHKYTYTNCHHDFEQNVLNKEVQTFCINN